MTVSAGGGIVVLNITTIWLGASVCLSPSCVRGLVGVGCISELMRSYDGCVAAYDE